MAFRGPDGVSVHQFHAQNAVSTSPSDTCMLETLSSSPRSLQNHWLHPEQKMVRRGIKAELKLRNRAVSRCAGHCFDATALRQRKHTTNYLKHR